MRRRRLERRRRARRRETGVTLRAQPGTASAARWPGPASTAWQSETRRRQRQRRGPRLAEPERRVVRLAVVG